MKELTGHVSPETAYLVDDYPYGFRLRCKIRYWLERNKHGVRLVSQTTNPKKPGEVWNKPKASTYGEIEGAMYLDGEGHVQWRYIGVYSSAADVLRFVESFPETSKASSNLRRWAMMKEVWCEKRLSGEAYITINDVKREDSPAEVEALKVDRDTWRQVFDRVKVEA
jgi:hypothetical protein